MRENEKIHRDFENPAYPLSSKGVGVPTNAVPVPNRWQRNFTWQRYDDDSTETPYQYKPRLWDPYEQSKLKGDFPIIGQDVFLNLTLFNATEFQARSLPTPSGISAARPVSGEFYGRSDQLFVENNTGFTFDLFKGETTFKPVEWRLVLQPIYNVNYTAVQENNVLNPDPRGSEGGGFGGGLSHIGHDLEGTRYTERTKNYLALEQAFAEIHLRDLSANYDFISSRFGLQPFTSDFRGFLFSDTDLGARIFGNADNNHWQYNAVVFSMREKDTYSGLNTFDSRDQTVFIANVYRQDFLTRGYTAQLSFHMNLDDGRLKYDRNGFVVRPEPIGTVAVHDVNAYYLGWGGDGHIGRFNLTHQFYQVFGEDELNGIAGQRAEINAQMFAAELSYDRDWLRPKLSFFYASGDHNAEDGTANGFDTILDKPGFMGNPFSYYVHQGFNLGGTAVNLKQPDSLVPNLRTSKTQGQSNFVNPGVIIIGAGLDVDVTPKLRMAINANYIRFDDTSALQVALFDKHIHEELGYDLSIGWIYRPLLTDNIIIQAGFGVLVPGDGFRDIYQTAETPVPGFSKNAGKGRVDDFYYNGVVRIVFTY